MQDKRQPMLNTVLAAWAVLAWALPTAVVAETLVAVAANFADVAARLERLFEARSDGGEITLVSGSTGKLYAQISHGAPYDVLLAADQERPVRLVQAGLAVAASRRTYAVGQLILWSAEPTRPGASALTVLQAGDFRRLAIANPELAPYGRAAVQALNTVGLYEAVQTRLVMGENVGQAHAMVATGNAELGLVARSYVLALGAGQKGRHWPVPTEWYHPIRQDAVLLKRASENPVAKAFVAFLASGEAAAVIERYGYGFEQFE